jgi:hypothetical protein
MQISRPLLEFTIILTSLNLWQMPVLKRG